MSIKAPKKVKIGPYIYSVHFTDLDQRDRTCAMAQVNYNCQTIQVFRMSKRQEVAICFDHEIVHVLMYLYAAGCTDVCKWTTETPAYALSVGRAAFIRDNPEADEWYRDLLTRDSDQAFLSGDES